MAAKIPVISNAIGGIPEVVTPETGILIPPARPEILATKIRQLLLQPQRRQALGSAGRERVERFFTLKRMAEGHHRMYLKILSSLEK
jgi:glycosyltransferase involved in cell wall biosynthesis